MTETTINGRAQGDDPLRDWEFTPDSSGRIIVKAFRNEGLHLALTSGGRLTCNEEWVTDQLAVSRPDLYDRAVEYLKRPRRFGLTRLADVKAEQVEWLWPDFIARGMVHLLTGYSKTNKSTLLVELARIISRGADWPCGAPGGYPGNVLLLSAEDSLSKTIRPRLDAAGGDAKRVFYLNRGYGHNPEERQRFNLASRIDVEELRDMVDDFGISVVFFDPLESFVGTKFDANDSASVRGVMDDLNDFADETGVAVIAIRHFRKSGGNGPGRAQDAIMGSRAFEASARITLMVTKANEDPNDWSRTLTVMQSNIGPDSIGIDFEAELHNGVIRCAWSAEGKRTVRPDELLSTKTEKRKTAREWLETTLSGGPKPAAEMTKQADEFGFKTRTLKRAKKELGVESKQLTSGWWWRLPGQPWPAECQPEEVVTLPDSEQD